MSITTNAYSNALMEAKREANVGVVGKVLRSSKQ